LKWVLVTFDNNLVGLVAAFIGVFQLFGPKDHKLNT